MFESLKMFVKGTKHNEKKGEGIKQYFFFNIMQKKPRLSRLGNGERKISVAMALVCDRVFPNCVCR